MVISRRLGWVILLAAILTAGILRQFHTATPSSPFLPAPIGSPIFFLILILFLVFARGWGRRQEVPYAGPGLQRFNLLAMVPFLIALMLEKWVSITLYDPLFSWLNGQQMRAEKMNAVFLIESAVGLMLISILLLPLFGRLRPLLWRYLGPKQIPYAALGLVLTLGALYGSLALVFRVAGVEGVTLRWHSFGRYTFLVITAQALIAFAEEFYYRGLLQAELAFLLPALGIAKERLRLGAAVGLISAAFALEHFSGLGTPSVDLRRFLFTFACSAFLGALLILMDNLWFCAAGHLVLNLFVLGSAAGMPGAGLQFVAEERQPLLPATLYISMFFALAFVFAYALNALGPRFGLDRFARRRPQVE